MSASFETPVSAHVASYSMLHADLKIALVMQAILQEV